MRTYGRVNGVWTTVESNTVSGDDEVWVVTLIQCLKLNLNESPFYSNYGIPSQQSVVTQIFPDFYVSILQQQFSPYFANLSVAKVEGPDPVYNITITTNQGRKIVGSIPV